MLSAGAFCGEVGAGSPQEMRLLKDNWTTDSMKLIISEATPAERFQKAMKKIGVSYELSTKFMMPGIFASITIFERFEPFQLLIASKSWARLALTNRVYKYQPRVARRLRLR